MAESMKHKGDLAAEGIISAQSGTINGVAIADTTHQNGTVTDHSDVSSAGSGAIITTDERTKIGKWITTDTVTVTSNLDLSSGFASGTLYIVEPVDGATITITVPDAVNTVDGEHVRFVKLSGVDSTVRVVTVDGTTFDESITRDNSGMTVATVENAIAEQQYVIVQDSRFGVSNATVDFKYDDSRFFGELGLPTVQGFDEWGTIPNIVEIVSDTVGAYPKDVIHVDMNDVGSTGGSIKPLVLADIENLIRYGGQMSCKFRDLRLGGNMINLQFGIQPEDNPLEVTQTRRIAVVVAKSGDFYSINCQGCGTSPVIVTDVPVTEYIDIVVKFLANPTVADDPGSYTVNDLDGELYVNGELLTSFEGMFLQTFSKPTGPQVEFWQSAQEAYLDSFGATIYGDSDTKVIPSDDLDRDEVSIITAPGIRNHYVKYPENYPGRPVGSTIKVTANNIGNVIFTNENDANRNFIVNGFATTSTYIQEAGNVIATNVVDGGNTYAVSVKSYVEDVENDKDLDLGTGTIIANSANIATAIDIAVGSTVDGVEIATQDYVNESFDTRPALSALVEGKTFYLNDPISTTKYICAFDGTDVLAIEATSLYTPV